MTRKRMRNMPSTWWVVLNMITVLGLGAAVLILARVVLGQRRQASLAELAEAAFADEGERATALPFEIRTIDGVVHVGGKPVTIELMTDGGQHSVVGPIAVSGAYAAVCSKVKHGGEIVDHMRFSIGAQPVLTAPVPAPIRLNGGGDVQLSDLGPGVRKAARTAEARARYA